MGKSVCALLAAAVAVSACSLLDKASDGNKSVDHVDEAASLHTSITSVTPWDDIRDKLKPGFALSAQDALNKSLPTTLARADQALDILRLQGAFSLGPGGLAGGGSSAASGAAAASGASTSSKVSTASGASAASGASSAASSSGASTGSSTGVDASADALLQYQTAANLWRDVAVLNSEIDNVARRRGQDAFLTRIQVSVMPLRHGLGYDVYANLSMFGSEGSFDPQTGAPNQGKLLEGTPLIVPILSTDALQVTRRSLSATALNELDLAISLLKGAGDTGLGASKTKERSSQANGDELEAVVTVGRLSDNTIRIRMGADPLPGGGYGMVPRTFNVSALVFLPKRANEIYYVSRLSLHHVITGTELDTKTRTPTYEKSIDDLIGTYARQLPRASGYTDNDPRYVLTADLLEGCLNGYAFNSDFRSFDDVLRSVVASKTWWDRKAVPPPPPDSCPPPAAKDASGLPRNWPRNLYEPEFQRIEMYLWAELIALNRHAHFAFSVVDVPRPERMTLPSTGQLIAYASDSKGVTVTLGFGNHLRKDAVDARLVVTPCAAPADPPKAIVAQPANAARKKAADGDATPPADGAATSPSPCRPSMSPSFAIPASSVVPDASGRSLTITFPPIDQMASNGADALKFAPFELVLTKFTPEEATAEETAQGMTPVNQETYRFAAEIQKKPDAPDKSSDTSAALLPGSASVRVHNGQGVVDFAVQGGGKKNLKVIVHPSVVTFSETSPKKTTLDRDASGNAFDVVDGGHYSVTIKNLNVLAPVQLELVSQADKAKATSLFTTQLAPFEEVSSRR